MKHLTTLVLLAASIIAVSVSQGAAEPPGATAAASVATSQAPALSSDRRAAISQELATRFRSQIKSGDFAAWSSKLSKAAATADPVNLLRATAAPNLEGMLAALNGAAGGGVTPQALGSPTSDVVYTPLPFGRCRIANSTAINSPLPANVKRSIDVEDISSYSNQGGTGTFDNGNGSTACGIPDFVTSLLVSVRVTRTGASPNGLIYLFPDDEPTAKGNILFLHSSAQAAAGEFTVRSCQTCAPEIAIRSTIPVDYIIDVIGYFIRPQATAIDCIATAFVDQIVQPGATADVHSATCPTGTTETSTKCRSSSWAMPFVYISDGICSARNNGSAAATVRAARTCCRVPGR